MNMKTVCALSVGVCFFLLLSIARLDVPRPCSCSFTQVLELVPGMKQTRPSQFLAWFQWQMQQTNRWNLQAPWSLEWTKGEK